MSKTGASQIVTGTLGEWQRLLEPLKANGADLVHLEIPRAQLESLMAQAVQVQKAQALSAAATQESTHKLKGLTRDGRRLAALLRQAVRQHYGVEAEKLTEFGVQPFRGRSAGAKKKTQEAPEAIPSPASATGPPAAATTGSRH